MAKVIDPIAHELLREIRELTGRQFIYEDPWHGFVPYDGAATEYQIGPPLPFGELGRRDKADVIDSFIHWNRYQEKGLDWLDQNAIENNVIEGKPPQKWLEGTSFLDPALLAERREELIRETFELSREIGYAHFRAENFDRHDPALVRLNPQEREAFLRQWWDGARERMYESYREQVAGLSNEELDRNRAEYKVTLAIGEVVGFDKIRDQTARQWSYQDILQDAAGREVGPQSATPGTVHFRGFTCETHWKTYPNGRPALYLVDANTRETVAIATADLPGAPLKPGEVFIKEHSENRGMLAALEKAGIVQATGETVRSGFVEVPVAKVMTPVRRQDRQDDRNNTLANESGMERNPTEQKPGVKDSYQDLLTEASQRTVPEKSRDKDQGIDK
jgi:hypothetical protein